jgi:hypothetical protein
MLKLAVPLESACCALYEPLVRVTLPVGVACPLLPPTVIVTLTLCRLVIVLAEGVTVTVGGIVPIGAATVRLKVAVAVALFWSVMVTV